MVKRVGWLLGLLILGPLGAQEEPLPETEPRDQVWGVSALYEVSTRSADSQWWPVTQNLQADLSFRFARNFDLLVQGVLNPSDPNAHTLDALFQQWALRLSPSDNLTLTGGKQRLKWGTTRVFTPADQLENRGNPLALRPRTPGVLGLRGDLVLDEYWSLALVLLPQATWRDSGAALRIEGNISETDFAFGAVKYNLYRWDTGTSVMEDRAALCGDFSRYWGSFGLYGEIQIRWGTNSAYLFPGMSGVEVLGGPWDPVVRWAGGLSYDWDLGLSRAVTLWGEYFYNGEGLEDSQARAFVSRYGVWQAAGFPTGGFLTQGLVGFGNLRRHYGALGFSSLALSPQTLGSMGFLFEGESGLFSVRPQVEQNFPGDLKLVFAYTYTGVWGEEAVSSWVFQPGKHNFSFGLGVAF